VKRILVVVLALCFSALAQQALAPDDNGCWSVVVNGLQARLSFSPDELVNGKPSISTYLELRRVLPDPHLTVLDVPFSSNQIQFEVVNEQGEIVTPSYDPMKDAIDRAFPVFGTLRLPYDSSLRFSLSRHGSATTKDSGAILNLCDLVDGPRWEFRPGDKHPYYLRARFSVKKGDDQHWMRWSGTIEIPKIKIPTTAP
jgi:hypothetical protein